MSATRVPNMCLKLAGLSMCGLFLACSERAEKRESVSRSSLDSGGTYCVQEPGTLRVSEDSVGPLDLRLSLQRLKAVCPAARDTVDSETNATYPSVVFPFKGLTVVATQLEDSLLPGQPADAWRVFGHNGLLYGRLPLTATWAAFRDVLGTGISGGVSRDGRNVTVMFCRHPRAFLDFERPDSVEDQSSDLSHIPSDARLKDIALFLRAKPAWIC